MPPFIGGAKQSQNSIPKAPGSKQIVQNQYFINYYNNVAQQNIANSSPKKSDPVYKSQD